jgi:hypothetical protein
MNQTYSNNASLDIAARIVNTTFWRLRFWSGLLLFFLGPIVSSALAQTNTPHRLELLKKAPTKTFGFQKSAARGGYVPADTVAFREYALDLALQQANWASEKLGLDTPKPITTDEVTFFSAFPKVNGAEASLIVNDRFVFGINDGRFSGFTDRRGDRRFLEKGPGKLQALAKMPSRISKDAAIKIAKEALVRLEFNENDWRLSCPPEATQFYFETSGNKRLPIPLYEVVWPQSPGVQAQHIVMQVSGTTRKLVSYSNQLLAPAPLFTNYFQLLNVPPHPHLWGKEYGYNPLDTEAFKGFARELAVSQINDLVEKWNLEYQGKLTTNHIAWFYATPLSNSFTIAALFTNRFYLEIKDARLSLFEDRCNSLQAFADEVAADKRLYKTPSKLMLKDVLSLAHFQLSKLDINENQPGLASKPTVKQARFPGPAPEKNPLAPFYEVAWAFPRAETAEFGDQIAIGVQLSGITKKVVVYSNNSLSTPRIPLPPNYPEIIGMAPANR